MSSTNVTILGNLNDAQRWWNPVGSDRQAAAYVILEDVWGHESVFFLNFVEQVT